MGWASNIFPLLIVTPTGGFTGLFVYSPGPGAGNLIASITSAAGTDPYGNHFAAGISSYDAFGGQTEIFGSLIQLSSGLNILQKINPQGYVVYSPTAGAGNEIASVAPAAFTDANGNAIPAGVTSFLPGTSLASLFQAGLIMTLTGAPASATSASIQIARQSAGQSAQINSGAIGAHTGSLLLLNDSGSSGAVGGGSGLHVVDGIDGSTYGTERLIQDNAANVVLSNTAFTSVFAGTPVAAVAYLIKADLLITVGTTATALIFQLVGPAVAALTDVKWRVTFEAGTGESVFAGHSVGNLNSFTAPSTTFNANSVVHVWLSALVTFSAASGTNLNLQVELGAASAGSQVSLGSTLEVMPV